MSSTLIADHALLSDCHGAALVTRDGSIDWLCFPRFDSPSIFARLLDVAAGHWSIRPAGEFRVTGRYLDKTMVLETTFTTDTGSVTVACGKLFHSAGVECRFLDCHYVPAAQRTPSATAR